MHHLRSNALVRRWDQTEGGESHVHDQARDDHGRKEDCADIGGHPPAVVAAVDVEQRQHDQVGIEEGEHAAEADAASPEDRSQRHIADGADKGAGIVKLTSDDDGGRVRRSAGIRSCSHHSQHVESTSPKKAPHKNGRDQQGHDI